MNADIQTVRSLLQVTADYFEGKGVESARLNAERLLADVLGLSRIELFMQHDRPVLGPELDRYRELVRRRAAGQPLQTILGETEFYSRSFKVEPGVFIPRPETARLVEIAARLLAPGDRNLLQPVAVEIGAGPGVIAVSLALELPRLAVWATDLNPAAVDLARRNAHRHGVEARVEVLRGSRFDPLPTHLKGGVDLLVSNLPYIASAEIDGLDREVAEHDPRLALERRRRRAGLLPGVGRRSGGVGCGPAGWWPWRSGRPGPDGAAIFAASGVMDLVVHKDYAGRDRIVTGRLPAKED